MTVTSGLIHIYQLRKKITGNVIFKKRQTRNDNSVLPRIIRHAGKKPRYISMAEKLVFTGKPKITRFHFRRMGVLFILVFLIIFFILKKITSILIFVYVFLSLYMYIYCKLLLYFIYLIIQTIQVSRFYSRMSTLS